MNPVAKTANQRNVHAKFNYGSLIPEHNLVVEKRNLKIEQIIWFF